jgi:uncharacterized protein (DUF1778 family)
MQTATHSFSKEQKDTAIAEQVKFALGDTGWQAFCDALDQPAMPIEATRKLLTEPSILDS